MKEAPLPDYSSFKTLVSSKGLLPQFIDGGDHYCLFAIEDNISWQYDLAKDGGSYQTDFETNYKSTCNQPLEYRSVDGLLKTASAMFTDSLSYWVEGANGVLTVSGGQIGYVRTNFSVPFKLSGVDVHWTNATVGDYINFDLGVYNNNDTSTEANFIQIAQFANQYRISGSGSKLFDVPTVKTVPPTYNGLTVYIRTTYANTGLTSSTVLVNLLGYK